jgi:Domain of unknown function (DUF4136)
MREATMNRQLQSCLMSAALLAAIALSGCAAPAAKVRVDKADTDLAVCRSFAWQAPSQDPASFTDQRVRAAAEATLKSKGYALVDDKPDCKLSYVLSAQEIAKSKPRVGVGAGGGSGGVGGGIGISLPIGGKKGQAGTFTIDVIDAGKNAQIWSGSIDATFKAPELTEEEAREVVGQVLDAFPNKS